MIKIDGEKIKALREKQGLTQLYMATAVGVTTDTISRWENKRYPTIKEENAEKLAEALEVEVTEILLVEEQENTVPNEDESSPQELHSARQRKFPLPLIIISTLIVFSTITIISVRMLLTKSVGIELSAERIMPQHALPNTPFPVTIKVQHTGDEPLSIILKESLPEGSTVIETSPPLGSKQENREIKWLKKVEKVTRFSYLIKINGQINDNFSFTGTVSTASKDEDIQVSGANTIKLGTFHWADTDGDNSISDQEILTVFDYYSGIDDFTVDIEFIEKMWLGSKYSWNEKTRQITISP